MSDEPERYVLEVHDTSQGQTGDDVDESSDDDDEG